MAISDQVARLISGKNKIKSAIERKGVEVPAEALIDSYDTYIDKIEKGARIEQDSDKIIKVI